VVVFGEERGSVDGKNNNKKKAPLVKGTLCVAPDPLDQLMVDVILPNNFF
jgi:hypothetical protein